MEAKCTKNVSFLTDFDMISLSQEKHRAKFMLFVALGELSARSMLYPIDYTVFHGV